MKRAVECTGPVYTPCTVSVDLDWLRDKDEVKRGRIRDLQARFPDDLPDYSCAIIKALST